MPTIQKRRSEGGQARYRALVRVSGHPTVSQTFRLKSDAAQWARDTEDRIRRGQSLREKDTVGEAIDRYVAHVLAERPKSRDEYERHLAWWSTQMGHFRLDNLTPALIGDYRDRLKEGKTHLGDPRSNACVNRYVASLSACLSIATREWGWLDANPSSKLSKLKEPRGRVRYLTDKERVRLLAECKKSSNEYLYPIVLIALMTGMRKGEILRLRWQDVDFARRVITIQESKNGERRAVPTVGELNEVLSDLAKIRRIDTNLLFPGRSPSKPVNPRRAFEIAVEQAGIDDFRFHDLRHCCASYLAMSGATERELMEVLGHKSPSMAKRYSHLSEQHTASVMERMATKMF